MSLWWSNSGNASTQFKNKTMRMRLFAAWKCLLTDLTEVFVTYYEIVNKNSTNYVSNNLIADLNSQPISIIIKTFVSLLVYVVCIFIQYNICKLLFVILSIVYFINRDSKYLKGKRALTCIKIYIKYIYISLRVSCV